MTKLTKEQEEAVKSWARDGHGLSEIQKRLLSEFAITATYMDVRFLAIDLGLDIKDKRSSAPAAPITAAPAAGDEPVDENEDAAMPPAAEPSALPGQVSVSLDRIMKPGSVVSGTVTFSDGVSASWYLDQMGRLALDAGQPGYSPVPKDIKAFQLELRRQLETRGF